MTLVACASMGESGALFGDIAKMPAGATSTQGRTDAT